MRFAKCGFTVTSLLGLLLILASTVALAEAPADAKAPDLTRLRADNLVIPEPAAPQRIALVPAAIEGLIPAAGQQVAANEPEASTRPGEVTVYRYNAQQSPYQSLVAAFISRYNKQLSWQEASAMAQAIMYYSQQYGVDFRLVTGLIAVESSFRTNAVSSSGAIGLGQLKPDTARWLGVADPYNPVDNIAGTTRFLGWLLKKYNGSLDHALSAYYQGPGSVDRNGITPVCYPYLQKVNKALSGLM